MQHIQRFLVPTSFLLTSCISANWFMIGGRLVDDEYAPVVRASYVVPKCTESDGKDIDGPAGIVFQLVEEGGKLALFERNEDGSGALITNMWFDEKGDHYFGRVTVSGWEYVFPKDPNAAPVRLVYAGVDTEEVGPIKKPITPVSATCPMVRAK